MLGRTVGARIGLRLAAAAAALAAPAWAAAASGPVLAARPPMGWNSWNHFHDKIDDRTVRAVADALVRSGLRDAGYVYVNIDDGWAGERDAAGVIHPNARFPDMRALGDYLHARGLKFGIYSSPGPKTCAGYEGSFGHEAEDARTYAGWGVDYLKYDLCSLGPRMVAAGSIPAAHAIELEAYRRMRAALDAAGRPIVFSLCQYGFNQVWRWGPEVGGNLWRTTGDIEDRYARVAEIGFSQAGLSAFAGPGRWNDPDMLEIGNGGLNPAESRTHMSLWALLAAPLLAGNDVAAIAGDALAVLSNREVIAIDQDPLGRAGDRLRAEGQLEVWTRPLAGGAVAVGLFNRSDLPAEMSVRPAEVGMGPDARVRDVWDGRDGRAGERITAVVAPHGVALYRLSPA